MNSFGITFFVITATALLVVPRRLAPVPLFVGVCYMTLGQGIFIGTLWFQVFRMLLGVGILRVLIRREWIVGRLNSVDKLMLYWIAWVFVCSAFHADYISYLTYLLGNTYNVVSCYFLMRIFCRSFDDFAKLIQILSILLLPVALEMILEQFTHYNIFGLLGGVSETVGVREGKFRAQGPFRHPILAGTVGGACFPLMIGLWQRYRLHSIIGVIACLVMVGTSGSSGPIMSLSVGIGALFVWRSPHLARVGRWMALPLYFLLALVMTRPPYYLIARIDLTGGSTGWHRARLIEMAIAHFDEWWLAGTEYTRHWMPTGLAFYENHTDITNYYVQLGVWGGAVLTGIFIIILIRSFKAIGRMLSFPSAVPQEMRFPIWSLGAALFCHSVTMISVSYFDQSMIFLYLDIAVVSSLYSYIMPDGGCEYKSNMNQNEFGVVS